MTKRPLTDESRLEYLNIEEWLKFETMGITEFYLTIVDPRPSNPLSSVCFGMISLTNELENIKNFRQVSDVIIAIDSMTSLHDHYTTKIVILKRAPAPKISKGAISEKSLKYAGIYFTGREKNPFGAYIRVNGVKKYQGVYPTQIEAHKAYLRALKFYFPDQYSALIDDDKLPEDRKRNEK